MEKRNSDKGWKIEYFYQDICMYDIYIDFNLILFRSRKRFARY